MNNLRLKALLGAGCFSLALMGSVHAGGFSRGSADTDIIFEDGNFNMRTSVTYVSPHREFTKNPNPALVGTEYTDDYVIPSAAVKFNLTDNFRCAGTMVDNNGGSTTYDFPKVSGKLAEEFTTNEKAVTCGVKFSLGRGNLWLLGGGFVENLDYNRVNALGSLPGNVVLPNANLELAGQDYGYRLGVAYDIPEIALRAQLMYRSGTSYGADGNLTVPTAALLGAQAKQLQAAAVAALGQGNIPLAQQLGAQAAATLQQAYLAAANGLDTTAPATGTGNLPQSVELKLQSGIAPGWLAFGSVKWMDWSVQQALIVNSPITNTIDTYNWKDGWTVTGGVGHAFTERLSGLVSLTWDQGVGTGWDLTSDTYTLGIGGSYKDGIGGELRGGVGLSYLTSATETQYAEVPGVSGNQAVKAGYAVALNLGYALKW
ncbi:MULTISPECIES: outer membrane protein transport protein [Mesorhizobium]|uniref:Long-chain fatty acid transport protein n=1 Tax=Rhizobium loti TaxID=381 RepID=A0A8E2W9S8_RHILI|nr:MULTISPECIES: outer membrane protein transport protein [Mesorhizobium]AZO42972.1 aromatic hydrocarbon degradation protein [Mesorhizobium sp. M7D.F.Ca.US.005.01.1.1]PWJ89546.1 long-chain fatty acid transport protein [Mesorhizobium loti]RUX95836.1 aromatic hydrocarbon degradation protein [Mesorhizobium sp. M7D.F.Ca.US.004.01.2.1]RVA33705.1 aromatic hydrocarbon degradation protein [Mesorhizobium sp. M7D.F.Ca.US.004.03.1.1]